jgi:hypothetical protein
MSEELYELTNEWYLKLKAEGFKDIELNWSHGVHSIRPTLHSPHPSGKRADKKFALSGDTSILLERYARAFIEEGKELSFFLSVCNGVSVRNSATAHNVKKYRGIYLFNKAMKRIKADIMLPVVPDYLRCQDNIVSEEEND